MPSDWESDERTGQRDWDSDIDLWENQGRPLTVRDLQLALSQASPDLVVRVVLYDGTTERTELLPMDFGFTGKGDQPAAAVLTVVPEHRQR